MKLWEEAYQLTEKEEKKRKRSAKRQWHLIVWCTNRNASGISVLRTPILWWDTFGNLWQKIHENELGTLFICLFREDMMRWNRSVGWNGFGVFVAVKMSKKRKNRDKTLPNAASKVWIQSAEIRIMAKETHQKKNAIDLRMIRKHSENIALLYKVMCSWVLSCSPVVSD